MNITKKGIIITLLSIIAFFILYTEFRISSFSVIDAPCALNGKKEWGGNDVTKVYCNQQEIIEWIQAIQKKKNGEKK